MMLDVGLLLLAAVDLFGLSRTCNEQVGRFGPWSPLAGFQSLSGKLADAPGWSLPLAAASLLLVSDGLALGRFGRWSFGHDLLGKEKHRLGPYSSSIMI